MDLLILVGTLFLCFGIGMPISYSLGFGALAGALWIGIPPEAVMLKISDGVSKVAMLTIPFFVLAGAIMAEGGMARRLVAFANVHVDKQRPPNAMRSEAVAMLNRASLSWHWGGCLPTRCGPELKLSIFGRTSSTLKLER